MRRQQGVRVANASRGKRARELALYQEIDRRCSDPLEYTSPEQPHGLTATVSELVGMEIPF
jgi:hypothetical protein